MTVPGVDMVPMNRSFLSNASATGECVEPSQEGSILDCRYRFFFELLTCFSGAVDQCLAFMWRRFVSKGEANNKRRPREHEIISRESSQALPPEMIDSKRAHPGGERCVLAFSKKETYAAWHWKKSSIAVGRHCYATGCSKCWRIFRHRCKWTRLSAKNGAVIITGNY